MGLFSALVNKGRSVSKQISDKIEDDNAVEFYELKIADSDKAITEAKSALLDLEAKNRTDKKVVDELAEQIARYKQHGGSLKSRYSNAEADGDEAGKTKIMGLLNELVAELDKAESRHAILLKTYSLQDAQIKKHKAVIEKRIAERNAAVNDLSMLKAQESMIKASEKTQAAFGKLGDSQLSGASGSLDRLKRRQEEKMNRIDIVDEEAMAPASFEDKLAEFESSSPSVSALDRF